MIDWRNILASPDHAKAPLRTFTVLTKKEVPFLYLPEEPSLAQVTLRLYPAQKIIAKVFIWVMKWILRLRLPILRIKVHVPVSPQSKFGSFLKKLAGNGEVPYFGVLGGYALTPERRYILLLFDKAGKPCIVVKVGITEKARRLIQQEQTFFFPPPPDLPGLPKALDFYQEEDAYAIAYRYEEGVPPAYQQKDELESVFTPWINEGDPVPFGDLPIWQDMAVLRHDNPELEPVFQILEKARIHPSLTHGDFAPWNIRVSKDGAWHVLDWERGRRNGVPAWGWFNYIVQYHILVLHSRSEVTISELEALWTDPSFLRYATRVGVLDLLKEMTLVYFLHSLHYFPPGEEAALETLANDFQQKYFPHLAETEA